LNYLLTTSPKDESSGVTSNANISNANTISANTISGAKSQATSPSVASLLAKGRGVVCGFIARLRAYSLPKAGWEPRKKGSSMSGALPLAGWEPRRKGKQHERCPAEGRLGTAGKGKQHERCPAEGRLRTAILKLF
jgi:hypothetical protein